MKKLKSLSELRENLVKEGVVFLMHQSILNFGEIDDWHYSFCYERLPFANLAEFRPSTSKKHSKNIKVFKIKFEEDSDVPGTGRDTYILLSLVRNVSVADCIQTSVSKFKGNLNPETLYNFKKAVTVYIRSHYKNRNVF